MRLTIRTNLAMRALMFCAVNEGRYVRKHEIAAACNASENHLAQVVNTLSQMGFVDTQRGRAGGLRLARPMATISVGQVCRAFETGVPFTECFDPEVNTCPLAACCRLRKGLMMALEAFYSSLDSLSLADLVEDNVPLEHLLFLVTPRRPPACNQVRPLPVH